MADTNTATEKSDTNENKRIIYWDDAHIENEAALMPPALREPYRRVKILCREQFKGDMDRVTEEFARVGAKRHKTTWSRIFKRGRLTHDAEGNELSSPLVSWKSLEQEFEALLSNTRVELQRNKIPFVETSIFNTLRLFIAKKMRPEWVNKFAVIIGATGLQKSATFKELAARNPNIKHVECPENASTNHIITLVAHRYGVGLNRSNDEKRFKVYESFGPGKAIIFDNTQDMAPDAKQLDELRKLLKFQRWLQDERGGTIINSITPSEEDAVFPKDDGFMEQFEGRCGGREGFLRLPAQNPQKDFVLIAEMLGLKQAKEHADLLQEIGTLRGRIRPYFEVLQEAKFAADADKKPFTIDYIEEAIEERKSKATTK